MFLIRGKDCNELAIVPMSRMRHMERESRTTQLVLVLLSLFTVIILYIKKVFFIMEDNGVVIPPVDPEVVVPAAPAAPQLDNSRPSQKTSRRDAKAIREYVI